MPHIHVCLFKTIDWDSVIKNRSWKLLSGIISSPVFSSSSLWDELKSVLVCFLRVEIKKKENTSFSCRGGTNTSTSATSLIVDVDVPVVVLGGVRLVKVEFVCCWFCGLMCSFCFKLCVFKTSWNFSAAKNCVSLPLWSKVSRLFHPLDVVKGVLCCSTLRES